MAEKAKLSTRRGAPAGRAGHRVKKSSSLASSSLAKRSQSKKGPQSKRGSEKPKNEAALKHLFNEALLLRIADAITSSHPQFDRESLLNLRHELARLEMKARVRLIRDQLRILLPQDYLVALNILRESLRSPDLKSFDLWPYTEFVQAYGLGHERASLDALSELTQRFTSEFAVRPFLVQSPKATLKYLTKMAHSENVHLRRWSSEGSRPRLPWGERLTEFIKNPGQTLEILNILKFDPELYVRKSVANHLNDIAKDHPDVVLQTLRRWKKEAAAHSDRDLIRPRLEWIIRHSLRTLIKQGEPEALKLVGVEPRARVGLKNLRLEKRSLRVGDRLEIAFEISSREKESRKFVIDYIIHFVRANGSLSEKVFKLKVVELGKGERREVSKSHHLKQVSTRTYYPGAHKLSIQINGRIHGEIGFTLAR